MRTEVIKDKSGYANLEENTPTYAFPFLKPIRRRQNVPNVRWKSTSMHRIPGTNEFLSRSVTFARAGRAKVLPPIRDPLPEFVQGKRSTVRQSLENPCRRHVNAASLPRIAVLTFGPPRCGSSHKNKQPTLSRHRTPALIRPKEHHCPRMDVRACVHRPALYRSTLRGQSLLCSE